VDGVYRGGRKQKQGKGKGESPLVPLSSKGEKKAKAEDFTTDSAD